MDFFILVEDGRSRWNVLRHPFYIRWSSGKLSGDDLALYAGQYRHAVQALADASRAASGASEGLNVAAREQLEGHAHEEAAHVDLWDNFAAEAGAPAYERPLTETDQLISAWVGVSSRDLTRTLAVLYAIEASQPAVSETKARGLVEHYGFEPGSPAIEYFEVHAERDVEHAAEGRAILETRIDGDETEDLARTAISALSANWTLLDGVERICAQQTGSGSR